MAMTKIAVNEAKKIADGKRLKPGRVVGTKGVQFTKGNNKRLQVIGWDEFERSLTERKLAIYESKGWMKIMRK